MCDACAGDGVRHRDGEHALKTVREINKVLQRMSAAGDILVIAERHQLVFHVVPQPSRLGWYTEVYTHLVTGQPSTMPPDDARASVTPAVDVAISSLQPMPAFAAGMVGG
jgi:hypothetical protein